MCFKTSFKEYDVISNYTNYLCTLKFSSTWKGNQNGFLFVLSSVGMAAHQTGVGQHDESANTVGVENQGDRVSFWFCCGVLLYIPEVVILGQLHPGVGADPFCGYSWGKIPEVRGKVCDALEKENDSIWCCGPMLIFLQKILTTNFLFLTPISLMIFFFFLESIGAYFIEEMSQ